MKRINHIVNPQGIPSDVLTRREERIVRGIDQAIASAQDQADAAEEKIQTLVNSLGKVSGAEDTKSLQEKLNMYGALCEEKVTAERYIKHFENLKADLDKEVKVVINPQHVVIDQK